MTRAAALLLVGLSAWPSAVHAQVAKLSFADKPRLVRCGDQPCFRILIDAVDASGSPQDLPHQRDAYEVIDLYAKRPVPVFYAAPLVTPGAAKAAERPIYSMMLFDVSGSMNYPVRPGESRFDAAVRVLRGFVERHYAPGVSRWAIVPFESKNVLPPVQSARFAATKEEVLTQLATLPRPLPKNNTALFSAIDAALPVLKRYKDEGNEARLFVFTDGKNEVYPEQGDDPGLIGSDGLGRVRQDAEARRVEIITIGFGAPGDTGFDEVALKALAWPNAGNYRTAEDDAGLARVLEVVQKQLFSRVQLTIGPIGVDKNQLTSVIPLEVRIGGRSIPQDALAYVPPPLTPVYEAVIAGHELEAFNGRRAGAVQGAAPAARRLMILGLCAAIIAFAWFVVPRVVWPGQYGRRRTPRKRSAGPKASAGTRKDRPACAHLEIVEGPDIGLVFPLASAQVTVGREGGGADLPIPDSRRSLSRRHCKILQHGSQFVVIDHSANGTAVNGQRILQDQEVPLRDHDTITLGDVVTLVFRGERA